jgi:hypothetical protein
MCSTFKSHGACSFELLKNTVIFKLECPFDVDESDVQKSCSKVSEIGSINGYSFLHAKKSSVHDSAGYLYTLTFLHIKNDIVDNTIESDTTKTHNESIEINNTHDINDSSKSNIYFTKARGMCLDLLCCMIPTSLKWRIYLIIFTIFILLLSLSSVYMYNRFAAGISIVKSLF